MPGDHRLSHLVVLILLHCFFYSCCLLFTCLPLMNPTGVSCFTPTFMPNIISVVLLLPVKTLKDETADLVK